jgi:Cu(I)/Ag(I) efflux system membrane protein CusA/SilA
LILIVAKLGETIEGLERYPINVRYPQSYRDSAAKLKDLPLITPNGARIALADVADIRYEDGPPMIKTENARPNGWVFVDIEQRDLGSYVSEAQQVVAEQLQLPAGYSLAWSGQYEYMERAKARLSIVTPITLVIIMLLLYFSFRRLQEMFIIMATLPLAMVGGLWLMLILGFNFSIAVGVGFIALSGVAVEIGVIMLVYLNQSWDFKKQDAQDQQRQLTADDLQQAISEGAGLRVRPVMMTVLTVIIGLKYQYQYHSIIKFIINYKGMNHEKNTAYFSDGLNNHKRHCCYGSLNDGS